MTASEIQEGGYYKSATVVYRVLNILPTTSKSAAMAEVVVFDHEGRWRDRKYIHLRELAELSQIRVKPR